jgi:large subunit ribosomal protein L18e
MKLEKYVKEGETAIVPGKVLSLGSLNKKMTVAALSFSDAAKTKINKNGEALSISDLLKKNPKASKVRIIK